ncbi:MAG: flagellar motor protein MotA [Alphaproteobacteria bacterium]|jgi:hypothetical protein|nr:flagellar motor protein MotA [Alphaproteobacteria bacterium]
MVAVSETRTAQDATPPLSRPTKYLARMVAFVIVVALLAGLLFAGLREAFLANPGLNGVILGVMLVGVAYSFRLVLALKPEVDWLERFRASWGSDKTAPPGEPPRLLAPMAKMLADRNRRMRFSALSLRSLLDGIDARLSEAREISRYLIGVLIFLGLLGTFWGLLQTIGAVSQVISGLSVDRPELAMIFNDLKEGLEAPLAGMGTAFSSSLFGLAGSLVLGFLELQVGQAQNRFFTELEDWLSGAARLTGGGPSVEGETTPIPVYLQALMETTAENLDSLQRLVAQGEEGRRQTNTNLNALVEKLDVLSDQLQTEQAMMARLAESQRELRPVLTQLSEAATSGAFGLDSSSREHIRLLELNVRRLLDQTVANRDTTVAEIRGEIKLLARTIAALAEEADQG